MILIRADANERIGTGHIMRCLSIANAFVHRGIEVMFVVADERGKRLVEQNGFQATCLHSEWTCVEGELTRLYALTEQFHPGLILIDSYYATSWYLNSIAQEYKVAYIDDMNLECYDVYAIINYNIYAQVYDYSWYKGTRTKLILYPQYAPLRDEFRNCPKHKIARVSDILVSAGGADPEHITERIMSGICPEMREINFHFIIGALNPRLNDIKNLAEGKENIVLHINEQHRSELMENCDLAIAAAGTTLYELCATGVPTITYTLADNQLVAAEQFDKQGIMFSAGDCRGDAGFIDRVKTNIEKLIADIELRRGLSKKMQQLVDGNGAERIVEALL